MLNILYSISKERNIEFRLTIFDGEYGIIKIKHWDKNNFITLLNNNSDTISIKTAGTIKKAKKILEYEFNNDKYM